MSLIYVASTAAMSPENTSRIIGPFLQFIYPGISDEAVQMVQTVIRKSAHATEYAVLALLVWRALGRPLPGERQPWNWRLARTAFLVTVLYAASDELHQRFVVSRTGQISDVALDAAGAVAALFVLWLFEGRRLGKAAMPAMGK